MASDNYKLDETGLTVTGKLTATEFKALLTTLGAMNNSAPWALGDAINYGENRFGEKYAQWIDVANVSYERLRIYAWIANRYKKARREPRLSFEVHRELAFIKDDEEQDKMLELAAGEGWSSKDVREWKRGEMGAENTHTPLLKAVFDVDGMSAGEVEEVIQHVGQLAAEFNLSHPKWRRPDYAS